jgi:tetratricopeptide (TPR) repeat protein
MSKNFLLQVCVSLGGLVLAASVPAQQDEDEESAGIEYGADKLPGADTGDEDEPDVISDFRAEDLDRDWEEPESEESRDRDELRRSFELYTSSLENKMYDEADTLAKRIVELSIKLYGIDSYDSAKALTNLGIVQYHNKEYESAQLNYQSAIDIIERVRDRLDAGLINPLKGLGAAQLSAGRPDLAKESFDRAVHVTHVNEGPHNLQQIDILDAFTETYLSIGQDDKALDVQESVVNLQMRNLDPESEDALPALERQANWMHRMQHYNSERLAYRRIIRILESKRGRDHLSLIPPLTGLGRSYLFVEPYDPEFQSYTPASGGEVYLKRALRIAEKSPESDWRVIRISMLALADFYTLADRAARARKSYAEIWDFLSSDDERLASRKETFESPVILQTINPTLYFNSARQNYGESYADQFERGTIVVGYVIDESGRATDITLI